MKKSMRRRRSRKSKTVDTPLAEDDSSSAGDSLHIENMGALETASRENDIAAFQTNSKTSKFDKGTPATGITDLVESDEEHEIYEVSSVSSGELMQRRRSAAKSVRKPVFIQDELEALRTRQLARNLRKDLQDAEKKTNVAVPFAAVDTELFYLKQREQNKAWKKKQEDSRNYLNSYRGAAESTTAEPPRKSTKKYGRAVNPSAATFEMDQFYSKQKAMNNDWKQKQRDANALLHQYRGYSDEKEQMANFSFEELVSWQIQAARIPLPSSPISLEEKISDDNSDAIIAVAPLPCLDDDSLTKGELEETAIEDSGYYEDSVRQQGGSSAHQSSSGMAEILDEMGEILVEMEEMSQVDVDGTKGEAQFYTPIAFQLSHESGASLGLPEDEGLATKSVPNNEALAFEEGNMHEELETSIILDLDEPLTDSADICKVRENTREADSLEEPSTVDWVDDEVKELSGLPDPDALPVDAVPTMEEDEKTKEVNALEEPSAVDLFDDKVEELSELPDPDGDPVDAVPTIEDEKTEEEDALEEHSVVHLVEALSMDHCAEDYDEQNLVVDLDDEEDHIDTVFDVPDEFNVVLDDILDADEAFPVDQLETASAAGAVVEDILEAPKLVQTSSVPNDDLVVEIQSNSKSSVEGSPQTGKLRNQQQAIGVAAAIEESSQDVAKKQTERTLQSSSQRASSTKTPKRTTRIVTPQTSRRSDDDFTACRTSPKYAANSPSRLTESTAASRSARRERHRSSGFNSYSPRRASVPIYRRESSKVQVCCTGRLILDLHVKVAGCERCLHFASPGERRKYDEEGRHYRINIVRGGCSRKCKLFPRTEKELPVRLCRQCFYDTHTHGKV